MPLTTDERREPEKAHTRVRRDDDLFVERFDLMVVDEHDDLVSGKRVDCFRELHVGVDHSRMFQPVAVQRALGIGRLNEAAERVWLAPVVLFDFVEDSLANEIADSDAPGRQGQGELEECLACRRLVVYRQNCGQRSPWWGGIRIIGREACSH